jgi:hypothetical protein
MEREIIGSYAENLDIFRRQSNQASSLKTISPEIQGNWWASLRQGQISGKYEGEITASSAGPNFLELRIDIDPRFANSPIMNRISGDFYQMKLDSSTRWRTYRESWIVDLPKVTWLESKVEVTGTVRFWKGSHPATDIQVIIPWRSLEAPGPAEVIFTENSSSASRYTCAKTSDCFRNLTLEVDITKSVNIEPILPSADTYAHSIRPADLPRRVLTIEEAYHEAGVCVSINPDHTIINDSVPEFTAWSDAELHDAMETNFSQYHGTWPNWQLWCLLCGLYEEQDDNGNFEINPLVGGIMFDYRGVTSPQRQGFAVFRKHEWFNNLVSGLPTTQDQAFSMRQFLYCYVHEAGHAFNLLHSWDKGRPNSLSWMNYPQRVQNFWNNFRFRFDDDELIHIRHGDRSAVIMGGDAWGSGEHLEAIIPAAAMSQVEGQPPLEFLLRSKDYFDYMEPVEIELRLRNLLAFPIDVDTRLSPKYGLVTIYIQNPDGRIATHNSVLYKEGLPSFKTLQPSRDSEPGEDRYSENISLSYGKYGFNFNRAGEYRIRAIYQDSNMMLPSNTLRLRIGHPTSREEDEVAQNFFTYQVGMIVQLKGSKSPLLSEGNRLIEDIATRKKDTLLGAKLATVLASSEAHKFFRIENGNVLRQIHKPNYQKSLDLTEPAVKVYKNNKQKALNISYSKLVRNRANAMIKIGNKKEAKNALYDLHQDLASRGVNSPVLNNIKSYEESIGAGASSKKRKK